MISRRGCSPTMGAFHLTTGKRPTLRMRARLGGIEAQPIGTEPDRRARLQLMGDAPEPPRATVRARIPRVARSAPSEMTGKIAAFFHSSSIDDQS
jgi:hypothetical protein